jgi:hypothetical protein
MSFKLRKLNDEGVRRFARFIADGATENTPLELLENPETSEPFSGQDIILGTGDFPDRYQFGIYLRTLLKELDPAVIGSDRNFWASLSLYWFDRICPRRTNGARRVFKEYHYILSADYRHYYRHLIRSPWYLVTQHGENSRFLLLAPKENQFPLSVHGEILEQVGGRQQVLASRAIISEASRMYSDPVTGRPWKGVAGSGRGSARRFGLVLRQLDLTYDPEAMRDGRLLHVLPQEFENWTARVADSRPISRPNNDEIPQPVSAIA